MRIVLQRVTRAAVEVDGKVVGAIGQGLLLLAGVSKKDAEEDAAWLADKVVHLRIFSDENGKMNRSALEVQAELLVVSQFTLYGDCRKGRRPSFDEAAGPESANELYHHFVNSLQTYGLKVQTGVFQAHMQVSLINDGPVTLVLESRV